MQRLLILWIFIVTSDFDRDWLDSDEHDMVYIYVIQNNVTVKTFSHCVA